MYMSTYEKKIQNIPAWHTSFFPQLLKYFRPLLQQGLPYLKQYFEILPRIEIPLSTLICCCARAILYNFNWITRLPQVHWCCCSIVNTYLIRTYIAKVLFVPCRLRVLALGLYFVVCWILCFNRCGICPLIIGRMYMPQQQSYKNNIYCRWHMIYIPICRLCAQGICTDAQQRNYISPRRDHTYTY